MPKILNRLLVVLAFGWTGSASAALMPPVTVNGSQWLQPVDFDGYSWNDINTVCDATSGSCNGSVGGNDLTGWTWASVEDVNALFNHYIGSLALGPGPDMTDASGASWLPAMISDGFLPEVFFPPYGAFIAALVRTTDDTGAPYVGNIGFARDQTGNYSQSAITNQTQDRSALNPDMGSWFFQDPNASSVPITNTMALMGLALCALGFTGRQRVLNT
jgi:hypothetical protein